MIHDNSTDRTALVPGTASFKFLPYQLSMVCTGLLVPSVGDALLALTGRIIAIVGLQRGIPSKRESSARVDYVLPFVTHRPSLLPIEWSGEVLGSRRRVWAFALSLAPVALMFVVAPFGVPWILIRHHNKPRTNPVNHAIFERKLRPKPSGRGHACLGVTHRVAPNHASLIGTHGIGAEIGLPVLMVRRDYPLSLSISISGGKETYKDSLSTASEPGSAQLENRRPRCPNCSLEKRPQRRTGPKSLEGGAREGKRMGAGDALPSDVNGDSRSRSIARAWTGADWCGGQSPSCR
ncbi:hypothetical protein L1887_56863 [Cichorium endivia]|nr:hypothetical protein L1887_56863 [Cichorium endivia]